MTAPNDVPNAVSDDAIDRALIAYHGLDRADEATVARLLAQMAPERRSRMRAVLAPWAERVRQLERRCAGLLACGGGAMSLAGFRARNHPQQTQKATRDDVDDRRTPLPFFAELHAVHGFTVDAAASPQNALLPHHWTRERNGLTQSWAGQRVWCNPPYSGIEAWAVKAWRETMHGGCDLVVMLLPANRCEQGWWQVHVEPYRDRGPRHGVALRTRFLSGRLRFGLPAGDPRRDCGTGPPFGCVLLTWERVA